MSNVTTMVPGVPGPSTARTSTNETQLFYHQFSGEVLGFFQSKSLLTAGRVMTRTALGMKSLGFPTYGQLIAEYHTPGTRLLGADGIGKRVPFGEVTIPVDGATIAHQYIANLDELRASYDLRRPVAEALGYSLAHKNDRDRLITIARTARRAGWHPDLQKDPTGAFTWGGQSGAVDATPPAGASGEGNAYQQTHNGQLRGAALATTAANFINALLKIRQGFTERNVPDGEIYLAIQPAQYYMLLNISGGTGPVAINRDWSPDNGSLAAGVVGMIAGMKLLVTTNMPNTDNVAATSTDNGKTKTRGNSYNGDFTNTLALAWHPNAIGVLESVGVTTESDYEPQTQASFMLAKYVRGSGTLTPTLAAELWGSDTAAADAKLFPDT